ncbi:MAG: transcriptional repressor [Candidatus Aureabacteria bacterium]|nr:transcriptional repressor [Candidatus Auribacterota bacterium]
MKHARGQQRKTRQRQVILEELRRVVSHPTANEVHHMVTRRLPRVSLGTVYRNLESMSRSGVILKLETAGTRRRYDGTPTPHYHARCTGCGCVADLRMEPLEDLERRAQGATGFSIMGHRLEYIGVCARCAGKKRTQREE